MRKEISIEIWLYYNDNFYALYRVISASKLDIAPRNKCFDIRCGIFDVNGTGILGLFTRGDKFCSSKY